MELNERQLGSQPSMTSASDALHDEEVVRTRAFLRLGWIVAAGVALAIVALRSGDPQIEKVLLAMLGGTTFGALALYYRLRDHTRYSAWSVNALAFAAILCGLVGILFVGMLSAASNIVVLGVFFFCRTEHRPSAIGVYVFAAGSHLILAVLIMSGAIEDPGFAPVRADCSIEAQIGGLLALQQLYALCFFLARLTRKMSLQSIEQLQAATRLAAVRDAQLEELRMDLDRALKIGGPGRFTGHVVGSWELGPVLGRGAMGEVYEATHVKTGAPAAVKLLRREMLSDAHHVERFFREVRVASAIESPHVVRVLEAASPTDDLPFLAMERLRGQTLGEILRAGPMTGAKLSRLVHQIGGVLEHANVAGIVHRDLKPHNLFLTEDGVWKVLDFGVAQLADTTGTLTGGGVVGTPAYMAPEQAKGEPVDHRADVYALGAVIYRSLTGRVPFVARDTPALLYAVVHVMPLRPSAFGSVSPQMEAFLALALAKPRDLRFATAADLVRYFVEAERGALPAPLQHRAQALLRQHPWTEPEAPRNKSLKVS